MNLHILVTSVLVKIFVILLSQKRFIYRSNFLELLILELLLTKIDWVVLSVM